jgi:hypothetical protein
MLWWLTRLQFHTFCRYVCVSHLEIASTLVAVFGSGHSVLLCCAVLRAVADETGVTTKEALSTPPMLYARLCRLLAINSVCCCVALPADEIGVQIEEPFGILPLEDVCVDIQVGSIRLLAIVQSPVQHSTARAC